MINETTSLRRCDGAGEQSRGMPAMCSGAIAGEVRLRTEGAEGHGGMMMVGASAAWVEEVSAGRVRPMMEGRGA